MPHTIETIHGTTKQRYSVTETAVELRKALKNTFPTVKFSVTSKSYSMGASIRISWTDGPTAAMVHKVGKQFAGADFNPTDDLKTHHSTEYQGQIVAWGADYVFTNRTESQHLIRAAKDRITRQYGIDDMPSDDIGYLVCREARKLYLSNGIIFRVKD